MPIVGWWLWPGCWALCFCSEVFILIYHTSSNAQLLGSFWRNTWTAAFMPIVLVKSTPAYKVHVLEMDRGKYYNCIIPDSRRLYVCILCWCWWNFGVLRLELFVWQTSESAASKCESHPANSRSDRCKYSHCSIKESRKTLFVCTVCVLCWCERKYQWPRPKLFE